MWSRRVTYEVGAGNAARAVLVALLGAALTLGLMAGPAVASAEGGTAEQGQLVPPEIYVAEYPESDPDNPVDPTWDGAGKPGYVTISSPDSEADLFWYGINNDPSERNSMRTEGGAARTFLFTPDQPGLYFITARAFDTSRTKSASAPRYYVLKADASEPPRLVWSMTEPADAGAITAEAEPRRVVVHGRVTPGTPGVSGDAVRFDGQGGYAATRHPVIDTSHSFSVSFWTRLPEDEAERPMVPVSQGGPRGSGIEFGVRPDPDGWGFSVAADSTRGAARVEARQEEAAARGVWTHVTGVHDDASQRLLLYIDGRVADSVPFATPADLRGPVVLGAAVDVSTFRDHFSGDLDEVRFYDYALSADQVSLLTAQQPLDDGARPAKMVWSMDEPPGATAFVGRSEPVAATLYGDARPGVPARKDTVLQLDGASGYAATDRPVLDTARSHTVAGWVRLDDPAQDAVLIAQNGAHQPGIALGFDADDGWSVSRASEDSAEAVVTRVAAGTGAVDPAEWTHLIGVFDAHAGELRLYVNGEWVGTTPVDAGFTATGPLTIGAAGGPAGTVGHLAGQVDDLRLYDRNFSDYQARQLYWISQP
ncbi:LamG domain-containing protein [Streptomyces sp. G-5]|uniref:LamG domain-containing protein n=1 Tax=Streptomyces sp. G-5 TaxID=2977231 RepID=UPI0021CE90F3|nr:LamG domain-containing protein [Streptomyces sp. G-5]MCU4744938.1 LamG domain-containing protein [Streptomyces sp. G-5]